METKGGKRWIRDLIVAYNYVSRLECPWQGWLGGTYVWHLLKVSGDEMWSYMSTDCVLLERA